MTNNTKAQIIAFVSTVLGLATAFDVALTQAQIGAITAVVASGLGLWVALTYRDSVKRIG